MTDTSPPSFLPFTPVSGRPIRLGVLISGGGTTLLNFLDQIRSGALNAQVPLVIASQKNCRGVERAAAAGLPSLLPLYPFASGSEAWGP